MSDTSARLLRLLSLLQARPDWSGPELAERLQVSTRTIRNDVTRLRELGYPVDAAPGVTGGYRLAAGQHMPPLLLDDDEAVAVSIGLRTAACTSIAGIEETSLRALAKLEQTLPSRLRRRIGALQTAVEPLDWGTPYAIVEPEALALLSQACRDREQVRFDYEDKDGTPSRRLVEPFRLVPAGRRWYLVAWDVRREDWRTFRLDRASRPRLAGVRGPVRVLPAPDAATYVQQSISYRDSGPEVTVVLHAPAEELEGRLPAHLGAPEPVDDSSSRLRTSADSIEWLALRLALSGVEFTVESPPEMRAVVRQLGERLARAAAG